MTFERPATIDDKTLAKVDATWRTAREIFLLVDEGAPVTVRTVLGKLADGGRIARRHDPDPRAGTIARYRACGMLEAATAGATIRRTISGAA